MTDFSALTAKEIVRLTRNGEASAVEVLESHLARIEEHNGEVNAIVSLDVDAARARAAELDALPAEDRGPLHGLPFAVKDTAKAVGFPATSGHLHFKDFRPEADDLHIARIRAAGATFIGKTNVPEMAAGSHTFNKVFGATHNPHDLSTSAGGSSGGAAAALASHFVPLADGSDMGGSLRNPAAFCGVVGFRPTPGVVPNADSANMLNPLATSGPLARNVADLALLLDVIAGPAPHIPGNVALDHAALRDLQAHDLTGLRVAYAPDLDGAVPVEPAITAALDALAARLEAAGATVTRACPELTGADEVFRTLRAAEFNLGLGELLAAKPETFNDFLTQNIREGMDLTGARIMRAQANLTDLAKSAAAFFTDYDLVLAPTTQVLPFDVELDWPKSVAGVEMGDYLDWMRAAWLFTPLGIPGISVPAGTSDSGLPIGAQLLAGPGRDVELLQIAAGIEALLGDPVPEPAFSRGATRVG